jgi:ABC-type polysaccharide/polyol phosphate export systems, permease component
MEYLKQKQKESWDMVIEPKTRLLDLNLKEIWRYRDLIMLFVRRDFVAQFKQTILGPLWYIIQPILTTLMYALIFGRIARIPTDGIQPPLLFYLSGITMWNYFATCLTSTANTFVTNANIFGKVYFPRLVLPLSVVISNLVRFGIQFLLLIAIMIYFHFQGHTIGVNVYWIIIPILLLMMAGIGLGLGIIISSLTTRYRDFAVFLTFAIQLAMYATPVVYPLSFLQNTKYKTLIAANPLTPLIESFRYALFGKGSFDLGSLLYSAVFMIVVLTLGVILFNKVEKNFMDTV